MEYSNIRWKKCDYKFAIKCFKLMAANKSLECEIDALGKVKASTDWRTGMDLFIMHKDVVPTFEKRGIFECEHFEKEFRTFLRIKLTPLGQSVFDLEFVSEIARVSQEGMQYYMQVMDLLKVNLNLFKVSKKGIPEYKI